MYASLLFARRDGSGRILADLKYVALGIAGISHIEAGTCPLLGKHHAAQG